MRAPDRLLASARAALSFLTIVPAGDLAGITAEDVGRGVVWFPLAGAAVGAAGALAAWATAAVLPALVAGLVAAGVTAVLTGALHLDGLADTADGYGGRTRERALEIMRDHAVGSYGVVALALDVGLRAAAVAALVGRAHGPLWLVAAGALSRSAAAGLGVLVPNARAAGLGRVLEGAGRARVAVAAAAAAAIAGLAAGLPGLAAAACVATLTALWGWHCRRRLGGVTGDTLGAASEGCEIAVLLAGAALLR
jgi:cobalamin 5'-phosphate synthase/cobalamin synthase